MKKSSNLSSMKDQNKKLVLDMIRSDSRSRSDIAQASGLTRASVSMIVDGLLASGMILEAGSVTGIGVGRNPTLLQINKDAFFAVGVSISRIKAQVGITNLFGEVLCEQQIPTQGISADACISQITQAVTLQLARADIPMEKLLGIGVCAPGPLDYRQATILNPPGFKAWHNKRLDTALSEPTGLVVKVENIADALALEEKYFGHNRDICNFMLMIINEEVGSGIIVDDKLYRGRGGFGGEIGHTSIQYDGILCECGNRGCLSRYIALPEVLAGSGFVTWADVMDNLDTQDEARQLFEREAQYTAAAIANAVNLFDLEKVFVGGDVSYKPEPFVQELNRLVRGRVITPAAKEQSLVSHASGQGGVRTAVMPFIYSFYY